MKIIIETHQETDEQIQELVEGLREKGWDIQVNNNLNDPSAPNDVVEQECNHHYVNGQCTKCYWLQV